MIGGVMNVLSEDLPCPFVRITRDMSDWSDVVFHAGKDRTYYAHDTTNDNYSKSCVRRMASAH